MNEILKKTIDQVSAHYGVAGGAVVVVKDGKTILKQPFGLADVTTGREVTDQSYFDIASNSKAFTTMICALLADQGRLDWDTPVRQYWPEFKMFEDYATLHATARDMGCHRTGLSRHDLIARSLPEELTSREEAMERLGHYVPSAGFREKHQYQNQVYAALGYVAQQITGRTWEDLVRELIAGPLGMEVEFRGHTDLAGKDAAKPHKGGSGTPVPTTYSPYPHHNPGGGIKTNLDSMEKWVHMLTAGGKMPDGSRFVSQRQFKELTTGVIMAGVAPSWNPLDKNTAYALGWKTSCYRGRTLVSHGGSVSGFNSNVGFFPEEGIGYAVMINSSGTCLHEVLRYLLCDYGLGCLEEDYSHLLQIHLDSKGKTVAQKAAELETVPTTAEDLARLCGHWWNDGYHDLYLEPSDKGGLQVRFGSDRAPLYQVAPGRFLGWFLGSGIDADCRFEPDGKKAVMSFCGAYTPTVFRKVQ